MRATGNLVLTSILGAGNFSGSCDGTTVVVCIVLAGGGAREGGAGEVYFMSGMEADAGPGTGATTAGSAAERAERRADRRAMSSLESMGANWGTYCWEGTADERWYCGEKNGEAS